MTATSLTLPEPELGAPYPAAKGPEPGPREDRRLLRALVSDPTARVGAVIVTFFVVLAVLAPAITPYDPLEITSDRFQGPSWAHPAGTDGLGRDLLSRLLFGARVSLGSAAIAGFLVMTIGVFFGTVAGYYRGLVDTVVMRVVDLLLALPGLVLAFAIAGLFQPGPLAVLLGLVSVWWVGYARIVRSLVLSIREREYVAAARAAGATNRHVIVRHILPNVAPAVVVLLTMRMGRLILAIAGLSFLGLGAQPPTPEWGAMLNEARAAFPSYPHIMMAPGLAITSVVVGLNLLGDGLRDVLDPRMSTEGR